MGDQGDSQAEDQEGCERQNSVAEIAPTGPLFLTVIVHNRPWCHVQCTLVCTKASGKSLR